MAQVEEPKDSLEEARKLATIALPIAVQRAQAFALIALVERLDNITEILSDVRNNTYGI